MGTNPYEFEEQVMQNYSYVDSTKSFKVTPTTSIDIPTNVTSTIDYSHHEIHAGSSFNVCYNADIANGATLKLLIVTPNTTKWAHMTYEVEGEAEMDLLIYEGATTTNDGTPITVFNRDRNSATTATVTAFHTPTVTVTGTQIRCWHPGAGKTYGGGDRAIHEIILKQGTKYYFLLTNATTSNNWLNIKVDWYEHTNK
jgi:hypothetical protein